MTILAGVDGCKGGWIVIVQENNSVLRGFFSTELREVLTLITKKRCDATAIDIPLGLSNRVGGRKCDELVNRKLGKNSFILQLPTLKCLHGFNSFPVVTPYFSKNDFSKFHDFNAKHEEKYGYKINLNTFCILNKLWEVNVKSYCAIKALQDAYKLAEFNPELSWLSLGISSSRKEKEGQEERIECLRKVLGVFPESIKELIAEIRKDRCSLIAIDDVLDAMVGLVAAKHICGKQRKEHCIFAPKEVISDNKLFMEVWD